MDVMVFLGMAIGFGCLLLAFALEGGEMVALLGVSPFLIVIGGTVGATMIGLSADELRSIPGLLKVALTNRRYHLRETIDLLANYAMIARKEGLAGLEKELSDIKDNFLRTALQLVADATDPEQTRLTLEQYIYATSERHAAGIRIFEAAGGYAPTMGIIGTVMGLIHVLSNISSPDQLGPSIALAFIATLYGVVTANLIWLPLATKLKNKSEKERLYQELILEGALAIQAGKSPTLLRSTLLAFVPPSQQQEFDRSTEKERRSKGA